jgi:serine/threonine-protein kinase RsbT
MKPPKIETFPLRAECDILIVRHAVLNAMVAMRFRLIEQTKMVAATSELSRNAVVYGGGGSVLIEQWEDLNLRKVQVTFVDKGPGIADIEQALSDGFTTGGGLGLGLGGAKRLVHQFLIASKVGEGTQVVITMQTHDIP